MYLYFSIEEQHNNHYKYRPIIATDECSQFNSEPPVTDFTSGVGIHSVIKKMFDIVKTNEQKIKWFLTAF